MSLPTDIQAVAERLAQLLNDYDIKSVSIATSFADGMRKVRVTVAQERASWDSLLGPLPTVGHRIQEAIRRTIKATEKANSDIKKQIADGEHALVENKRVMAMQRDLIQPPLIELAKCADEPLRKEDLNWLGEEDYDDGPMDYEGLPF